MKKKSSDKHTLYTTRISSERVKNKQATLYTRESFQQSDSATIVSRSDGPEDGSMDSWTWKKRETSEEEGGSTRTAIFFLNILSIWVRFVLSLMDLVSHLWRETT